jgi:hypothetical protein
LAKCIDYPESIDYEVMLKNNHAAASRTRQIPAASPHFFVPINGSILTVSPLTRNLALSGDWEFLQSHPRSSLQVCNSRHSADTSDILRPVLFPAARCTIWVVGVFHVCC